MKYLINIILNIIYYEVMLIPCVLLFYINDQFYNSILTENPYILYIQTHLVSIIIIYIIIIANINQKKKKIITSILSVVVITMESTVIDWGIEFFHRAIILNYQMLVISIPIIGVVLLAKYLHLGHELYLFIKPPIVSVVRMTINFILNIPIVVYAALLLVLIVFSSIAFLLWEVAQLIN